MSRFQARPAWPFHGRQRPGRGKARHPYRMSSLALEARLRGLAKWRRPRTTDESRHIYLDIVQRAGQESYRNMARRLGVAHSYCRKLAVRYYGGRVPRLERTLPNVRTNVVRATRLGAASSEETLHRMEERHECPAIKSPKAKVKLA